MLIKNYSKKIILLIGCLMLYCLPMTANDHIQMKLKSGNVLIKLRPDLAPNHVQRISELVESGFYNGLTFHRVIDGFMAQGGDPLGNGTGGSGQLINAEFSNEKHVRGTVSMPRAMDPNSADSQFFICFKDASWVDGQYTIWGQVVKGMKFIDEKACLPFLRPDIFPK